MLFEASNLAKNVGSATSIEFNEMIYEFLRQGKEPIVLSYGEAPFDPIKIEFEEEIQNRGAHYSESKGIPGLRERLIAEINSNYKTNLSSESNILLTTGSKIASYLVFLAFVNPDDVAVLHEPAWVSYREHARLVGSSVNFIKFNESLKDGLVRISEAKIPKMLVLNNPNNPRGKVYTEAELAEIINYCFERGIFVLVDESYSEYVESDVFVSCVKFIDSFPNVIVLRSISKDLGLSGWRIGFIISSDNIINSINPLNQHLVTCAPTVLQLALVKNYDSIVRHARANIFLLMRKRESVRQLLDKYGLTPLDGDSTFYFFVDIGKYVTDVRGFCYNLLKEELVSVIPGAAYGESTSTFIRISFAMEPVERIELGLQIIAKRLGW